MAASRQQTDAGTGATPTGTPLALLLGQAERQVARALEQVLGDLTVDQWRVLDLLATNAADAGRPMSEIAATVAVPSPTLTKIVDRLVDSGLVFRLPDDHDRRRVLVFPSDAGRELHARIAPGVAVAEAEALAALGADASVLLDLLGRLTRR